MAITITRLLGVVTLLVAAATGDTIMTILLEGTQYYVSSMNPYQSELNYFLAYQHCRSLGLQLASFQTKDKAETIMQYLQNEGYDKDFWTSGNKLGKNMAIWMSTGQPFNATFTFMRPGTEHNGNLVNHYDDVSNATTATSGRRIRKSNDQGHDLDSGCVALMAPTFQWDLDDCQAPKHYICEQSRCYYYNYASIPVAVTKGTNTNETQSTVTTLPAPTLLPGFSAAHSNSSAPDAQPPATTFSTDVPPLPDYSENLAARRFPFASPSGVVYVTAVGVSEDTLASTMSDEWNAATEKNE